MNLFVIVFILLNSILLLFLKKKWAPLPLLCGTCYMPLTQAIEVGPFHFTIIRILIAVGVVRIFKQKEYLKIKKNSIDWALIVWSLWALFSSLFHNDTSSALVFRLGIVYNTLGIYFLLRIFCSSFEDLISLFHIIAIILTPLALLMLYEKLYAYNLFSVLGAKEFPAIREGHVRAQGPFGHSILAGTVGAVCLPMMIGFWSQNKKIAFVGILSCLIIIYASTSSGPILSGLAGICGIFFWAYRKRVKIFKWMILFIYVALDVFMKAPAYFILGKIDITGGSTGWYRARLIQSAFEHLSEWWLGGTDYTRHWMQTAVAWSQNHTDITNQYLEYGVIGGIPLMIIFIIIIYKEFSYIGNIYEKISENEKDLKFITWTMGASLFAHAVTCISVSYFDQSFIFLYMTISIIASMASFD